MADLGVRPLDAAWRHRVHDIASPLLGPLMMTCAVAGVGAVFAPVVGLIWLGFVAGLIAYAGIKAALERP
jgi:hypothetical protein